MALGVVTLLIWGNSMRTSTQSAQQSGSLLAFLTLDAMVDGSGDSGGGIPHHFTQVGPLL